jgi:hypothetical protein
LNLFRISCFGFPSLILCLRAFVANFFNLAIANLATSLWSNGAMTLDQSDIHFLKLKQTLFFGFVCV